MLIKNKAAHIIRAPSLPSIVLNLEHIYAEYINTTHKSKGGTLEITLYIYSIKSAKRINKSISS